MIRVVGNAPLWVDVGRSPSGAPILVTVMSSVGQWLGVADAAAALRAQLQAAEWQIEGVLDGKPSELPIEDGRIVVVGERITPIQSEHLRALLERAETVVRTGCGDMNPEGT